MADEQFSQQDIKDLQEISSKLPAGHPTQKKISTMLSSQPTQFEKDNAAQPMPSGGTAERAIRGVGRGLMDLIGNPADNFHALMHPYDTAMGAVKSEVGAVKDASHEPAGMGRAAKLGAAVPFLGPIGQKVGRSAASGDVAGAIGEGLTAAAAPSVIGESVGRAVGPIKRMAGRFEAAPAVSVPGTGGTVKFRLRPEPEPNVQSLSESPNYNKIQAARLLARRQAAADMKPLETPPDPDVANIDYDRNKKINSRNMKSPGSSRVGRSTVNPLPPPGAGGTPTGAEIGMQEAAETAAKGKLGSGLIHDPNSPPAPEPTTYQSYTRNELVRMARQGDVEALKELRRSPADTGGAAAVPNSKFMLEPGSRMPFRKYNLRGRLVAPRK